MASKKNGYKLLFFDRAGVIKAIGRKRAKVLSRIGAVGRRVMMRLMRKGRRPHYDIVDVPHVNGRMMHYSTETGIVRYADTGRFVDEETAERTRKAMESAETKQRSGASRPGEPPRRWVGSLRDLIFFSYDQDTDSVVYGPLPFKPSNALSLHGSASVAEILDQGGVETVMNRRGVAETITIQPRPFRAPTERIVAPIAAKIIEETPLK